MLEEKRSRRLPLPLVLCKRRKRDALAADCRRPIMDWGKIRQMAADPLVTIGALNWPGASSRTPRVITRSRSGPALPDRYRKREMPAASHRTSARVFEWRLPVADPYRALSFRCAVRVMEQIPAGQRRLGENSIGALHPPDQKPCRDDPEKPGGEEEGELHPLRCKRDAA
jgi:hypothetical protein